jgi:hypothetical protein
MATRDQIDARFTVRNITSYMVNLEQTPDILVDQFEEVPVSGPLVEIEMKGGRLALVQTTERGAAPVPKAEGEKRQIRAFRVPHIETSDIIMAESVEGVRAFGSDDEMETYESEVNRVAAELKADIDLTKANMALGAMMGVVRDADGSIIYDFYQEFGVVPNPVIGFNLSANAGNVKRQAMALKRRMHSNLKLGPNTQFSIVALAGDEFFDELLTSEEVLKAYDRYQDSALARGNQVFEEVPYAGILWRNYRGTDGGDTEAGFGVGIKPNEVRFAPINLPGLYKVFNAPADYAATRRTLGQPYYGAQEAWPAGASPSTEKGTKVIGQANPLFVPLRPASLEKGVIAAK